MNAVKDNVVRAVLRHRRGVMWCPFCDRSTQDLGGQQWCEGCNAEFKDEAAETPRRRRRSATNTEPETDDVADVADSSHLSLIHI